MSQPKQDCNRDSRGRFRRGNKIASAGGFARAAALDPDRRTEIARAARAAMVATFTAETTCNAPTLRGLARSYTTKPPAPAAQDRHCARLQATQGRSRTGSPAR